MEPKTLVQQLLFSTVRIESDKPSGTEAGTSFIFNYNYDAKRYLFLITNRHVIQGAQVGRFFFTLADGESPQVGKRCDIRVDDFQDAWVAHPDSSVDVAAMPLAPIVDLLQKRGQPPFIRSISSGMVPNDEQMSQLDALEEVVFIGYPSGMFDSKNLMPIIRRGTTATPVQFDFDGSRTFLVDASVFPGSSGSPVLICNQGFYTGGNGLVVGNRALFLGVLAQAVFREEEGKIRIAAPSDNAPIVRTQQMIDLGVVYKSATVVETVEEVLRRRAILS